MRPPFAFTYRGPSLSSRPSTVTWIHIVWPSTVPVHRPSGRRVAASSHFGSLPSIVVRGRHAATRASSSSEDSWQRSDRDDASSDHTVIVFSPSPTDPARRAMTPAMLPASAEARAFAEASARQRPQQRHGRGRAEDDDHRQ
eukprot:7004646-Prymnesium_polylepis.1